MAPALSLQALCSITRPLHPEYPAAQCSVGRTFIAFLPRHAHQPRWNLEGARTSLRPTPIMKGCRLPVRCSAAMTKEAGGGLSYNHLLLAIMDNNPYCSDGSKQALATAAGLANTHASKLTILLVDQEQPSGDQSTRIETISWHLKESGFDPEQVAFQEISLASEETHNSSVVVGNAVDQIEADLVLLSTEAVHSKAVDANLLAEFVDCPVLLLP